MPTFTTYDGSELTCRVLGEPAEPVVVLPGGPLRASRYLGNLGGLDARRELVMLELPRRRVDRIVADVEALREHLGLEIMDVVAHSAGGNLALLYAAAHPDRLRRLTLVAPGTQAVGLEPSGEALRAALARRSNEPWFDDALRAVDAWFAGDDSPANEAAAGPFFYGRWDAAAQAHAAGEADEIPPDAEAIYFADGAFDADATRAALAKVDADVLVLVGGLDASPTISEGQALAELFSNAELVVQPGAGHFPWLDDPARFARTLTRFLTTR